MSLRRKRPAPDPPAGLVGDHADKLSHVRPLFHDEDERQSMADHFDLVQPTRQQEIGQQRV